MRFRLQHAGLQFGTTLGLLLLSLSLGACQSKEAPPSYAARVGDYLRLLSDPERSSPTAWGSGGRT